MAGEHSLRRCVIYPFAPVEYCKLLIAQTVDLGHFAFKDALSESRDQLYFLCRTVPLRQQIRGLEQQAISIPIGGNRLQMRSGDESGNVAHRIMGGHRLTLKKAQRVPQPRVPVGEFLIGSRLRKMPYARL
jgi:hypothetical protein